MTNKLLLPNKFKLIGWCILIPATLAGLVLAFNGFEDKWITMKVFAFFSDSEFIRGSGLGGNENFSFITTHVSNTIAGCLFIAGGILVSFSKEKVEDEFIANLRLSSLLWSVWVNYILLLFAFIFVWGFSFMNVMIYNMFTILIIFIIRFNYILYTSTKSMSDEK